MQNKVVKLQPKLVSKFEKTLFQNYEQTLSTSQPLSASEFDKIDWELLNGQLKEQKFPYDARMFFRSAAEYHQSWEVKLAALRLQCSLVKDKIRWSAKILQLQTSFRHYVLNHIWTSEDQDTFLTFELELMEFQNDIDTRE